MKKKKFKSKVWADSAFWVEVLFVAISLVLTILGITSGGEELIAMVLVIMLYAVVRLSLVGVAIRKADKSMFWAMLLAIVGGLGIFGDSWITIIISIAYVWHGLECAIYHNKQKSKI